MIRTGPTASPSLSGKPRASGDDPAMALTSRSLVSVNPARAGMILTCRRLPDSGVSKPRASGDDPAMPYPTGRPVA